MLDSDKTLHIRCGSDIEWTLKEAGFIGDFLEFSDPFCQGPVPDMPRDRFIETRAAFIAGAYALDRVDTQKRLAASYARLDDLARYDGIVLWFEHDSYDQLILAYLLHYFHETDAALPPLELICIDRFEGIDRFIGLGQLNPFELKSLWPARTLVNDRLLWFGDQVWQAIVSNDPTGLYDIAFGADDIFPIMHPAIERHLRELPDSINGLGETAQVSLRILADKGPVAAELFHHLMQDYEALPYLGDMMYRYELECLADTKVPAITLSDDKDTPWHRRRVALTPFGADLLGGRAHWYGGVPRADRHIGGVTIQTEGENWQWSRSKARPTYGPWSL